MRKNHVKLIAAFVMVVSVNTFAWGETADTDKSWSDEAEISYVKTSGNSDTTTFSGKNKLKYQFTKKLGSQWDVAALYGEDSQQKTAERYSTDLKLDYLFTESFYSGLGAGWLRDEFAGFKNRYYVGPFVGYKFFNGPEHFLKTEVGVNYAKEEYVDNTDDDFMEGRGFGLYEWKFNPATKFSQSLEYLHDFSDSNNYKINSMTAITATITQIFSVKTSYEVRYVNRPVPDTLENTDQILTVALVANL